VPKEGTSQDARSEKARITEAEGKPCRHKIGPLTSVQVANFLAYLRKFNVCLDALQFQITHEALKEITDLLEAALKKLPKE
jgi:hypothetical protein